MSWRDLTEGVRSAAHEVFAEEVPPQYFPRDGGPAVPISGIFRDAGTLIEAGEGANLTSTTPMMGVKLSELPGPINDGDEVLLGDGRRFRVTDPGLDGEGGADMALEEIEEA